MSKVRAVLSALRIDKLSSVWIKWDILELAAMYLLLSFHIVMIACIVYLFKWFLFVVS